MADSAAWTCTADEEEQNAAAADLLAWMLSVEVEAEEEDKAGRAAPTAAPQAQSEESPWTPSILRRAQ